MTLALYGRPFSSYTQMAVFSALERIPMELKRHTHQPQEQTT